MRSSSILASVACLLATAVADFHIYEMDTIAADPYSGSGLYMIFHSKPSLNCDDISSAAYIGFVGDASDGGARCAGCPFDADSVDDWDITEFEWKDDEVTTWNTKGWVTLYKNADDPAKYDLHYVNEDRTESGVITNSYCERAPAADFSCTGPALANSITSKLFSCYTSLGSFKN